MNEEKQARFLTMAVYWKARRTEGSTQSLRQPPSSRWPRAWIYERTRKNTIPHRKLGKHIRFTDSDLSAIIRMCSRGPETETGTDIKEQLNA